MTNEILGKCRKKLKSNGTANCTMANVAQNFMDMPHTVHRILFNFYT